MTSKQLQNEGWPEDWTDMMVVAKVIATVGIAFIFLGFIFILYKSFVIAIKNNLNLTAPVILIGLGTLAYHIGRVWWVAEYREFVNHE